jgi:hypothetical protein
MPKPEDQPDEFAHIPARGNRPPILALLAVGLAVFLAVRLRHDVVYAFSSAVPADVGEARALAAQPVDALPLNKYVRLSGTPERESAVILDTRGSWKFSQFFRLRDTGGRVFVKRLADPLPVSLAEHDRFTGRLLRFSDLSFAESISRHFGSDVAATRFFRPEELASDPSVRSAKLFVDVLRPGQYQVQLPRLRFADRAAGQKALEGQGARLLPAPAREDPDHLWLEVEVPEAGRERVLSAIGDLDRSIRLRQARETLEVAGSQLSFADGNLVVAGAQPGSIPRAVPRELVASIRTRGTVQIPADAVLLIEGERPRDSWPSLVVLAFLLAFALVNLLGLRRPA